MRELSSNGCLLSMSQTLSPSPPPPPPPPPPPASGRGARCIPLLTLHLLLTFGLWPREVPPDVFVKSCEPRPCALPGRVLRSHHQNKGVGQQGCWVRSSSHPFMPDNIRLQLRWCSVILAPHVHDFYRSRKTVWHVLCRAVWRQHCASGAASCDPAASAGTNHSARHPTSTRTKPSRSAGRHTVAAAASAAASSSNSRSGRR